MQYRKEIDGLRALAVIPVILFHAGFETFSGGYIGVDIFFVISGYLITSIILNETQAGSFTITGFYERRIRRIFPALYFVILSCLPFAWMWMQPKQLENFGQSLMAVIFFVSNFLFWKEKGYFEPLVDEKPLLHTWSLGVEEQYYVIFPLLLIFLLRFGNRKLVAAISLIFIVSLSLAEWGSYNFPSANFYLLPSRAWELLAGSLCAIYLTNRDVRSNEWLSIFGLSLIFYSIFAFDGGTPFPSIYALIPVTGVALLILFCGHKTITSRLLSLPPMVFIGLISYSVYLWHQPLFAFARLRSIDEPSPLLYGILVIASLALGFFSWRFIERPFRNKQTLNRQKLFRLAAAVSLLVVAIGGAGDISSGFENRLIDGQVTYADLGKRFGSNPGLSKRCDNPLKLPTACRTDDDPEIIVWGDSYAMHLVKGVVASKPDVKLIQMTKSVCGPFLELSPILYPDYNEKWAKGCLLFNEQVMNWLKNNDTVKYAILSSPFHQYATPGSKLYNKDGPLDFDLSVVLAEFEKTLSTLEDNGIKPVVFAPPPADGKDLGQCLAKSVMLKFDPAECDFTYQTYANKQKEVIHFLKEIERNHQVVWIDDIICNGNYCRSSIDSIFIYRDKGHLSNEGVRFIGKKMNFYELVTKAL